MGHTSKRVTALMLALTMISTFPATTVVVMIVSFVAMASVIFVRRKITDNLANAGGIR